jgi:branched-chain amino acid transport system ATP-binding protein
VIFNGRELTRLPAEERAQLGIGYVPEGRGVFPRLSVEENLRLGVAPLRRRQEALRRHSLDDRMAYLFGLFPVLAERRGQAAGTMSGGEQQMLALARALLPGPALLVLDEPSLGLAPVVVEQLYAAIANIRSSGIAVLLVEQYARWALRVSDHVHLLRRGRLVHSASAADLGNRAESMLALYLGQDDSVPLRVALRPEVRKQIEARCKTRIDDGRLSLPSEIDRLAVALLTNLRHRLLAGPSIFPSVPERQREATTAVDLVVTQDLWEAADRCQQLTGWRSPTLVAGALATSVSLLGEPQSR